MVPDLSRTVAIALIAAVLTLGLVAAVPVNSLPFFSDDTGPTDIEVASLERLDAGCKESVAQYSGTQNGPNGSYTTTSFVETGSRNASLSAWAERTSPTGAEYSTFDVHVESHRTEPANTTCDVGIQYRLTVETSGGGDDGLLPDESGLSVRFHENGRYAACASSSSGDFGSACRGVEGPPTRTWANATG
ncbi:hypothetical protein [Salinibaculum rarum]|uniref:hypothetical protein n=1 Tax=Salinibaculum rarum TaxID=3058903 RepID=UPI00266013FA|nr:hypothetical protein [Salinibaculum sp. KK48]